MSISTHVLDTSAGRPAANVPVALDRRTGDTWERVADARTDPDGRVSSLEKRSEPGTYRIRFSTSTYFGDAATFYPYVDVVFTIRADEHHHVPLLISPFGYSTYRGS